MTRLVQRIRQLESSPFINCAMLMSEKVFLLVPCFLGCVLVFAGVGFTASFAGGGLIGPRVRLLLEYIGEDKEQRWCTVCTLYAWFAWCGCLRS